MTPPSLWSPALCALGLESPRPMVASDELSDAVRVELARYLDHQEERTRVIAKRLLIANLTAVAFITWLVLGSAQRDFERAVSEAVAAESVTARAGLARETAAWRVALEERTELVLERARADAAEFREGLRAATGESLREVRTGLETRVREARADVDRKLQETASLERAISAAETELRGTQARAAALSTVLAALERKLTGRTPAPREALDEAVRAIAAAFDERTLESRALELWLRADETAMVAFGGQRSVIAARATGFTGGTLREVRAEVWDPSLATGRASGVTLALGGADTLSLGPRRYQVELVAALDRQEAASRTEGNAVQLRITALP